MIKCEACNKFFPEPDLIWDLKEDRMVCIACFARLCGCPISSNVMDRCAHKKTVALNEEGNAGIYCVDCGSQLTAEV